MTAWTSGLCAAAGSGTTSSTKRSNGTCSRSRASAMGPSNPSGSPPSAPLPPVRHVLLECPALPLRQLPPGEVRVGYGERSQLRLPPVAQRLVRLRQLAEQQVHRPAIGCDVVHHHQQHMVVRV